MTQREDIMGAPDKGMGHFPEHSASVSHQHERDNQETPIRMPDESLEGQLSQPAHEYEPGNDGPSVSPSPNHNIVSSSPPPPIADVSTENIPPDDTSVRNETHPTPHPAPYSDGFTTASHLLQPGPGQIVEEVVDEMPEHTPNDETSRTFVIPKDPTTQPLVQKENVPTQSYAEQLAAALRMKTSELSWLFIEAEGRLALAREWTAEARAAGEANWARYMNDIDLLESALQDARSMLDNACDYS